MISSVVANCAVGNAHNRGSAGAIIANAAAIISRHISDNDAAVKRHCRRTSVVYAAAIAKRRVVIDRAITKGQRGMIIVHAAAIENGLVIGVSVSDSQRRYRDGFARGDMEYATLRIAVYTQIRSAGT